jgi:hypothetical protein
MTPHHYIAVPNTTTIPQSTNARPAEGAEVPPAERSEYTIRRTPHGIAVFGSLPVSEFNALTQHWGNDGYRWLRTDIAEALGATVAIVRTKGAASAWLAELDIRPDHPDWLRSGDTGLSSKTIYATFLGDWTILRGCSPAAPRDAADFGRCHRLLARYPEWRLRLSEVAAQCGDFSALVPIWGELETLFSAGDFGAVTDRLRGATKNA